ncbi:MAG: hypothetical protein F9K16_13590 [Thermoanaerobaculia bacterium]|nr:MAG: hypothetical protein F9K16_13590 [Thermoanaerobaculia bacterium]
MSSPARFALAFLLSAPPLAAQLASPPVQLWDEGSAGLLSSLQSDAHFGWALAAGDFDCDGFDDLAVGVPDDDDQLGAVPDTGYVLVLYGGAAGLSTTGHQLWDQQSLAAAEEEADDRFGDALATGDFDGDGCADLAIGISGEDIGTVTNAGAIQIVYGSASGLTATGNTFFRQGAGGISANPEPFDYFGQSLAAGDFDADGFDDLAIGAPGEDIETAAVDGAGAVHVLFGSAASGLTGTGDLVLFRGNGLPGAPEEDELLGFSLAAGNFNYLFAGDELAVGAVFSAVSGSAPDGGRVLVLSNLAGAILAAEYTQDSAGVPGVAEGSDAFGWALAAGDFDGNGVHELAVGVPNEDDEGAGEIQVGCVNVLDFDGGPHQLWLQEDLNPEHTEENDLFGNMLATGDFDADGADDLVIGVYREDLGPLVDAGLVHVVHGEPVSGLGVTRDQIWLQALDPSEQDDRFGFGLAAGRFSGHSGMDLAIGAPYDAIGGFAEAGAVNVFHSAALFRDGFESGGAARWSSVAP